MSPFTKTVVSLVKRIPPGKVATYGQIAALAGKPHAARGIAWILHTFGESHKLPWQRVINTHGRISFRRGSPQYRLQKKLLLSEKIRFDRDDAIVMEIYQWKRMAKRKRKTPHMFA
jgi:methylated-DNA-protein-cysteine methyltransferase-like protein